ncbi:MAG: hypothetical protein ACE5GZ_11755 [Gammaproteobacteria bacterium]
MTEITRPRYTNRPFPSYRYVPGKAPHPTRDPDGHSYNKPPPLLVLFNEVTAFRSDVKAYFAGHSDTPAIIYLDTITVNQMDGQFLKIR